MIPKIIHYCWFGRGELPELAKRCIASWQRYCPDYTIIRWDEDSFDVNSNRYVREAYESKKYAFVTDYVRLFALVSHGIVWYVNYISIKLLRIFKRKPFCESYLQDMLTLEERKRSRESQKKRKSQKES